MHKVESIANWLVKVPMWISAITILLMMIQVSVDVFMKYTINYPVPMTIEIVASYMMPALVFLPLGYITQNDSHLEVELFTQNLQPRALAWFKLFGYIVGIVFFFFVLRESTASAIKMTSRGEYWDTATLQLPIWISRWFLPIGSVLTLIWLVLHSCHQIVFALTERHLLKTSNTPHDRAGTTEEGVK